MLAVRLATLGPADRGARVHCLRGGRLVGVSLGVLADCLLDGTGAGTRAGSDLRVRGWATAPARFGGGDGIGAEEQPETR